MKLAIIGVGLIGGSLGLCLKDKLGGRFKSGGTAGVLCNVTTTATHC